MKGSFLKLSLPDGQKVMLEGEILEHRAGIEYILGVLLSEKYGCIKSLDEIEAVGHRVVHGGERFNSSVLITDEVIEMLNECIELAPLHNPPNLKGIYAIQELMPNTPQVGVFDTAFHQTMPIMPTCMGYPTLCMRSMAFVVMVSMELAIDMYPRERANFWVSASKSSALSRLILVMEDRLQPSKTDSQLTPAWV